VPFGQILDSPNFCASSESLFDMGAFQKRGHFFSPERAAHTSPGQRPGKLLKKILSPVRALHK